jgi:ADP-heptose:LPS heptosyltransferase
LHILLFRAGALGDILLLRPTVAALRGAGYRVLLLAPSAVGGVLCGPGEVDEALPADGAELATALAEGFGDGRVARAVSEADLVVAYSRSGPMLRLLETRARGLVVRDPTPPASGPHAARWLAAAVAPLLADATVDSEETASRALEFTEAEQREAAGLTRDLPARFLAVHPGSGSAPKNWPSERFFEVARRISGGEPWLLAAGPAEADLAPPPEAFLAREWPPRVLGAALARAGLFLGNDSGVSHLAAAAGAPTLALFGPTDPALWAPLGPRVEVLRARAEPPSVLALAVEDVVAAAARLRSAASGPPSG